jgi:hypothetical protein
MRGMGVARTVDGFVAGTSTDMLDGLDGLGERLVSLVTAATRRSDDGNGALAPKK